MKKNSHHFSKGGGMGRIKAKEISLSESLKLNDKKSVNEEIYENKTGYATRWNDSHQKDPRRSSPIRLLRNRPLRYGRTVHHVCVCTAPNRHQKSFLRLLKWAFRRHGGGVICAFRVSERAPHPGLPASILVINSREYTASLLDPNSQIFFWVWLRIQQESKCW